MAHELPPLDYAYDALEPFIDKETMQIHHDKHHQAYVNKLNAALEKHSELQEKPLEELLANLSSLPEDVRVAVQNHGGGTYNHTLFFATLKKNVELAGEIKDAIESDLAGFEKFKEAFTNAAIAQFGSGWAWLVYNPQTKKLEVTKTSNQDSPLSDGKIPLLGIDVWEHAYYLKYQNKRPDYIAAFFSIINWEKVNELFLKAKSA